MAVIRKKIYPEYFDLVMKGRKKFEFRVADFDIEEGDTFVLQEWNPKTKKFTGRSIIKKVSYMIKLDLDSFGQRDLLEKNGFYILQLDC
jgi:hypothetical protein